MLYNVTVQGGKAFERDIAYKTVIWCLDHFEIKDTNVDVRIVRRRACWGDCVQEGDHSYTITVTNNQTIRDFVATITHEVVHVNQWETGEWDGDGEAEAYHLQHQLADKLWKQGVL